MLIVIAIIGLLSAIVLVFLGGARGKAKDARIQSDIAQIRTVAEMIYGDNYAYYVDTTHGLCLASGAVSSLGINDVTYSTQLTKIANDIYTQNSNVAYPACYTNGVSYCVSAKLNGSSYVCIGSGGKVQTLGSDDPCTSAIGCD